MDAEDAVGVVREAIRKLTSDERVAARTLGKQEARYLVDAYYQMQENRIRSDSQVRAMAKDGEPHATIQWLADMNRTLEQQIKVALDAYSGSDPVGEWARSNLGVGPVIAAGLLAHLDVTRAPVVGHFWSFAGLDPRVEWGKGQKRPWNAKLKTLCWKLGEAFVKVSGNPDAYYGRLYKERKELETSRNEAGEYRGLASAKLEKFRIGADTQAHTHYASGKLPPAHIHARAKRYAVKMFLSHLHLVMYWHEYGSLPPKPFAVEHLGHAHIVTPPNLHLIPELEQACKKWARKATKKAK
ncbi:MAG: hypothetical protein ACK4WM_04820 [Thermoflexales bacterium]